MYIVRSIVLIGLFLTLVSCFSREEKPATPVEETLQKSIVQVKVEELKDKSPNIFARYFEQADAVHREAWWVMSDERRPVGKSPFGKVQRALLSSLNIKLSNKSLFSCDRYLVQRDVLGLKGFPQKVGVFEKCSEKAPARKIAEFEARSLEELQVTFTPENLQEVLGLGASILNKPIICTLRGNDKEQLVSLKCKDWAQDRSKEQMIRLDVYDYEKEGKNLIKLRGKVYENLMDKRKIVADVPMEGKISVTETELYAPAVEPAPVPTPTPKPTHKPKVDTNVVADDAVNSEEPVHPADLGIPNVDGEPLQLQENGEPVGPVQPVELTPLPGSPEEPMVAVPVPAARDQVVDPDVMMQREVEQRGGPIMDVEYPEAPIEEGVPLGR